MWCLRCEMAAPLVGSACDSAHFPQVAIISSSSTTGTTEDLECAGRGICDRVTGVCKCFQGYGADDGRGNGGGIANCGYRVPYVVVDTSRHRPWDRESGVEAHGQLAERHSIRRRYGDELEDVDERRRVLERSSFEEGRLDEERRRSHTFEERHLGDNRVHYRKSRSRSRHERDNDFQHAPW